MRRSLWALYVMVLLAVVGCGSSGSSSAIVAQHSNDYCYLTAGGASAILGKPMAPGNSNSDSGVPECLYIPAPGQHTTLTLNIRPAQEKSANCGPRNPVYEPESKVYSLHDGCVVTNSGNDNYPLGVSIEVYGVGVIEMYTPANSELPPNIKERLVAGGKAIAGMLGGS